MADGTNINKLNLEIVGDTSKFEKSVDRVKTKVGEATKEVSKLNDEAEKGSVKKVASDIEEVSKSAKKTTESIKEVGKAVNKVNTNSALSKLNGKTPTSKSYSFKKSGELKGTTERYQVDENGQRTLYTVRKDADGNIKNVQERVQELNNEMQDTETKSKSLKNSLGKVIGGGFSTLGKVAKSTGSALKDFASSSIGKLKDKLSGFIGKINGVVGAFARIAKYRFIRFVIKEITAGFGEGIKNIYAWSHAINGEFASSMDSMTSSLATFKNSLGAMVAPLLNAIAPAVNYILGLLTQLTTAIGQLFSALTGQAFSYKATKQTTTYADALGSVADSAGSASKAMKQLAGFDELNNLSSNSSSGGSGSGSGVSNAFTTEDLPNWAQAIKDSINKGDWNGAATLLAEKLNSLVEKFDAQGFGEKLGAKVQKGLEAVNTFLEKFDWKNLGTKTADFINGAISKINGRTIGSVIANKLNAGFSYALGLVKKLNWGGIGSTIRDAFKGFFEDIDIQDLAETIKTTINGAATLVANSFRPSDWGDFGEKLAKSLNDAVSGLDTKTISSAISNVINSALSLVGNFLSETDFKELGKTIAETIGETLSKVDFKQFGKAIGDLASGILDFIGGAISDGSLWSGVMDALKNFFKGLGWDGVLKLVEIATIIGAFKSLLGDVFSTEGSLAKSTSSIIGKFLSKTIASSVEGQTISLGSLTLSVGTLAVAASAASIIGAKTVSSNLDKQYTVENGSTDDYDSRMGSLIGSVLAGAAAGAGIGALAGGVNAIPGAIAGAIAGVVSGLVAWMGATTTVDVAKSIKSSQKNSTNALDAINKEFRNVVNSNVASHAIMEDASNKWLMAGSTDIVSYSNASQTASKNNAAVGVQNIEKIKSSLSGLTSSTISNVNTQSSAVKSGANSAQTSYSNAFNKMGNDTTSVTAKVNVLRDALGNITGYSFDVSGFNVLYNKLAAVVACAREAFKATYASLQAHNIAVGAVSAESVSSRAGTIFNRITYYAEGGIPQQGTLALVGERVGDTEILGNINGRTGVVGGGEVTDIENAVVSTGETEAMLLREQNNLLRQLIAKSGNVSFAPSASAGKWIQQSQAAYAKVVGA